MPNASSTPALGRRPATSMGLAALVGLAAACSSFESEEAQEVAQVTKDTVSRGVGAAKEQLDKVDTEKIERTLDGVVDAVEDSTRSDSSGADPLADAKSAIKCDEARERCTMTADFADRARQHGTKAAEQVRVSSASDVRGVRIDSIDKGTLAELVGLRAGDVVTHVNGTPLGSMQDAMMLYMSVRSAQSFDVDYQRGGKARKLHVDVV